MYLQGHFSYMDSNKSNGQTICHFIYLDEQTMEAYKDETRTILSDINALHVPYDSNGFHATIRTTDITDEIRAYQGRQVRIMVKISKYSFVSRAKYNKGDIISGVKFTILDIQPIIKLNSLDNNL